MFSELRASSARASASGCPPAIISDPQLKYDICRIWKDFKINMDILSTQHYQWYPTFRYNKTSLCVNEHHTHNHTNTPWALSNLIKCRDDNISITMNTNVFVAIHLCMNILMSNKTTVTVVSMGHEHYLVLVTNNSVADITILMLSYCIFIRLINLWQYYWNIPHLFPAYRGENLFSLWTSWYDHRHANTPFIAQYSYLHPCSWNSIHHIVAMLSLHKKLW